jgi:hypothetical protein
MASQSGKIDNLERVIIKLSEDFKGLEARQIDVLKSHIETSATTVIATLKDEIIEIQKVLLSMIDLIKSCEYNKEITKLFEEKLGKIPEGTPVSTPGTPTHLPKVKMAKDDKSPTGLKPATISNFTCIPKP